MEIIKDYIANFHDTNQLSFWDLFVSCYSVEDFLTADITNNILKVYVRENIHCQLHKYRIYLVPLNQEVSIRLKNFKYIGHYIHKIQTNDSAREYFVFVEQIEEAINLQPIEGIAHHSQK